MRDVLSIKRKKRVLLLFIIVALLFFSIFSIVFNANEKIIIDIRLPRVLAAVIVGAMLGVSGALMQGVLKNRLASPFTLGVSHGAMFGVSFAIVVLNGEFIYINAFLFSFIVMVLILLLSNSVNKEGIILAGVALGAIFTSLSMFLQYFATEIELSKIIFWSFGDLSKANIYSNSVSFIFLVIGLIFIYFKRWDFNALEIIESENVGVNTKFLTITSLLIATLLTSVSVTFFGIIAFVGLIAPYFARMICGNYEYLFFFSGVIGALIVVVSDFISRMVLYPIEIPIGIITSFIGGVVFLMMLRNRSETNY